MWISVTMFFFNKNDDRRDLHDSYRENFVWHSILGNWADSGRWWRIQIYIFDFHASSSTKTWNKKCKCKICQKNIANFVNVILSVKCQVWSVIGNGSPCWASLVVFVLVFLSVSVYLPWKWNNEWNVKKYSAAFTE